MVVKVLVLILLCPILHIKAIALIFLSYKYPDIYILGVENSLTPNIEISQNCDTDEDKYLKQYCRSPYLLLSFVSSCNYTKSGYEKIPFQIFSNPSAFCLLPSALCLTSLIKVLSKPDLVLFIPNHLDMILVRR